MSMTASLPVHFGGATMITGDKNTDRIMEIAEAVFAYPEPSQYSEAVCNAKVEALRKLLKDTEYYREHGFLSELVHTVFTKKLKLIKDAETVKELHDIEKACVPRFNGNDFNAGEYHIPEEELILWSLTSLKGPLVDAGMKRFTMLFKQVFGIDVLDSSDGERVKAHLLEVS